MQKLLLWMKKEAVLTIAWVLGICSAFLIPPDEEYFHYFDWNTLILLFCFMVVMAGLERLSVFSAIGTILLRRVRNTKILEGILVFLCFFFSMLITNDVALLTFVPFTLGIYRITGQVKDLVFTVVLQTVAANLGSMLTPIGNPQNLYLYGQSGMPLFSFFRLLFPYTLISFLLILFCIFLHKGKHIAIRIESVRLKEKGKIIVYFFLFFLCLCCVARLFPEKWLIVVLVLVCLLFDRSVFFRVDYTLLFTFLGFFLFVGNIQRISILSDFFHATLNGHEVLTAVFASQIISNVPAALLLSGFTKDFSALLIGTNLGGLGTLIASMASLISFKFVAKEYPEQKKRYLILFTGVNLAFLVVLLFYYFCLSLFR
jgi:Na+/H+ antiporter NhaD/arsenite permease-like protein